MEHDKPTSFSQVKLQEKFLEQSDMFFLYPSKCHLLISAMHQILKSSDDQLDFENRGIEDGSKKLQLRILG